VYVYAAFMSAHWLFPAIANTSEFEALIAVQALWVMHVIAFADGAVDSATPAAATVAAMTAAASFQALDGRALRGAVVTPTMGTSLG
jgi:hypothetical protein